MKEGGAVRVSIKLGEVELPSQTYEADDIWPLVRQGAVSIILDILSLEDPLRVEDRVEIRMSYESFLGFWATTQSEPFASKHRTWLADHAISTTAERPRHELERGRTVLRAQVARISYAGSDAELSFYALPVGNVSLAMVTNAPRSTIPIAGILRVTTTTEALARFLAACAPLADKIRPMVDEVDRDG